MGTLEFDIAIAGDSSGTEVGAIVSKERGGELKAGIIGLGAGILRLDGVYLPGIKERGGALKAGIIGLGTGRLGLDGVYLPGIKERGGALKAGIIGLGTGMLALGDICIRGIKVGTFIPGTRGDGKLT